jgi:hypothetical protein
MGVAESRPWRWRRRWPRIGEARRVTHPRRFGGEIDAALDARQPIHHLLDARRAGRAAHAGNAELEHLWRHVETGLADRPSMSAGAASA